MATEKTKLEWAVAILTAVAGSLGFQTLMRQLAEATVGGAIKQLMHDPGPDVMDEISRLEPESMSILLSRINAPRDPFTKAHIVSALDRIKCDPNTGRGATLSSLAKSDEDAFYGAITLLSHPPLLAWARNLTSGDVLDNMNGAKAAVSATFEAAGRAMQSVGRSIDAAAGNAAPVIDGFADGLEKILAKMKKKEK